MFFSQILNTIIYFPCPFYFDHLFLILSFANNLEAIDHLFGEKMIQLKRKKFRNA